MSEPHGNDMDIIGLELSDAGILAAGGGPPRLLPVDGRSLESPGYALELKKRLLIGGEAYDQTRIHPRGTNNRFWSQLSTHPLSEKTVTVSSYAEIALRHLEKIRNAIAAPVGEWIPAVPGFMDEAKLGILLGIFRELDVPVKGLVNSAVAAVRPTLEKGSILHLDTHLHRIEITRCSQGERIEVEQTQVISDGGWHDLSEQLANHLANEFVRATRFDPLHDAQVEQQLYSRLAPLLRKPLPGDGEPLELNTGKTAHTLSVLPQMLNDASATIRERIVDTVRKVLSSLPAGEPVACIQLSHRAALVPGLHDALISAQLGPVEVLPVGSAALGAVELADDFSREKESKGATFLTGRIRRSDEPVAQASVQAHIPEAPSSARPTHILTGSKAYAIAGHPLGISADPRTGHIRIGAAEDGEHGVIRLQNGEPVLEPGARQKTSVDGRPVLSPVPLALGQHIQIDGSVGDVLLIHVESGDGA